MFGGNTNDSTTLADVLADLAERFALRRICVVADRGLMSAANIDVVAEAGFDHLLATKLRRDAHTAQALAAIDEDTVWVEIPDRGCRAADVALEDGTRTVVVHSDGRARRDVAGTAEIIATAEAKLRALELRVRAGRLTDPAKIGAAAQRDHRNSLILDMPRLVGAAAMIGVAPRDRGAGLTQAKSGARSAFVGICRPVPPV